MEIRFRKALFGFVIVILMSLMFMPAAVASDNGAARYELALGRLVCDANPCTTDPCLPGVIMYIERLNGTQQELTMGGSWITECFFDWNGDKFEDGDCVLLIGQASDTELEIIFILNLFFLQGSI